MKIFIVAAFVALCVGHALTTDDIHYVDGQRTNEENIHIWTPDNDSSSVFVDLQEPVDDALLNSSNGAHSLMPRSNLRNPTSVTFTVTGNDNNVRVCSG